MYSVMNYIRKILREFLYELDVQHVYCLHILQPSYVKKIVVYAIRENKTKKYIFISNSKIVWFYYLNILCNIIVSHMYLIFRRLR